MQTLKSGKEINEMPKSNRLSYALYLFVKHIQIDPNWLLLRFSELSTRDNYRDYYFNLVNEENAFLNPILMIVIHIQRNAHPRRVVQCVLEYFQR